MREMNGIVTVACLCGAVACTGGGATSEETPGVATGITADTLLAATETLASDEFEGRAPGSDGETKTVAFLTEQFSALGLTPGNPDGTWVQDVPLVGITPLPGDNLVVTAGGESRTLEPAVDYVAATKHVVDEVEVSDAEFVFVGYGARAPEYDWDDFGETDVSGKILLFLVNDPPLDDVFGGPAMTYYGRWTYKHEIAAELGRGRVVRHPRDGTGRLPVGGGRQHALRRIVRSRCGRRQPEPRHGRGLGAARHRRDALRDGGTRLRRRRSSRRPTARSSRSRSG